jgi:hypothetical protein
VEKLVLIDAQGFIDGNGMSGLPRPLAAAGVWVLRTKGLRMAANRMAYHDQGFATEDAMRVGRLHTHLDGWCAHGAGGGLRARAVEGGRASYGSGGATKAVRDTAERQRVAPPTTLTPTQPRPRMDANIAFMRGGGYAISQRLKDVQQPVRVWPRGRRQHGAEARGGAPFSGARRPRVCRLHCPPSRLPAPTHACTSTAPAPKPTAGPRAVGPQRPDPGAQVR